MTEASCMIYYHLSYIINYVTFSLAVYPTCFDIYNIILKGISFYVAN
jgi:hypothetical protein